MAAEGIHVNLTNRPVYVKSATSKGKPATPAERARWEKIRALGCIIKNDECEGRTTIHHTGTGAGGRKNHNKVLPLCVEHHQGVKGINSLQGGMSRRRWEATYGTEAELLIKLEGMI